MKHLLTLIAVLLLFVSCKSGEGDSPQKVVTKRTVIVYMAAENDLTTYAQDDIDEMINGMKLVSDDYRLIVFVDRADANEKPFIARITGNKNNPIEKLYQYTEDFYNSDTEHFYEILQRATSLAPANEYGLVLWGHATGWLANDSIAIPNNSLLRKAYGRDTGDNKSDRVKGKWLNIPSMRMALNKLNIKWEFIFCDCCNMMGAEVAYELRNNAEYFIASPAEIPGDGAPYDDVVPALFSDKKNYYEQIADAYFNQIIDGVREPITVTKMSEMQDFAEITNYALQAIKKNITEYPNMDGIIYYYNENQSYQPGYNIYYDIKDFVRQYAPADVYNVWEEIYNRTVVYKTITERWMTNKPWYTHYTSFTINEEKYGGISMFIPQPNDQGNYSVYNEAIKQFGWYYAAGWSELGW